MAADTSEKRDRKGTLQERFADFRAKLPHAWRYMLARRHKVGLMGQALELLKKLKGKDRPGFMTF